MDLGPVVSYILGQLYPIAQLAKRRAYRLSQAIEDLLALPSVLFVRVACLHNAFV